MVLFFHCYETTSHSPFLNHTRNFSLSAVLYISSLGHPYLNICAKKVPPGTLFFLLPAIPAAKIAAYYNPCAFAPGFPHKDMLRHPAHPSVPASQACLCPLPPIPRAERRIQYTASSCTVFLLCFLRAPDSLPLPRVSSPLPLLHYSKPQRYFHFPAKQRHLQYYQPLMPQDLPDLPFLSF